MTLGQVWVFRYVDTSKHLHNNSKQAFAWAVHFNSFTNLHTVYKPMFLILFRFPASQKNTIFQKEQKHPSPPSTKLYEFSKLKKKKKKLILNPFMCSNSLTFFFFNFEHSCLLCFLKWCQMLGSSTKRTKTMVWKQLEAPRLHRGSY